jgi:16S rRNA pseudouridine516 synthase
LKRQFPDIQDYEAVIFDLDGTLIDSMGMWGEIDIEYLERFGIEVPENLQRDLEGLRFTEVAEYFRDRFGIKDSVEEIGKTWIDMAEYKYRHDIPLKPGVREFIRQMADNGIRMAIASSNHKRLIEEILRIHGISEYFDVITTCDDVTANKPEPDVYLYTAEKLGTSPSSCLVFEDIPIGIRSGKRAGMTVAAVYDTYSENVREQKEREADFFIQDYYELLR